MPRINHRRQSSNRIKQLKGKTLQGIELAMFVCPYLTYAMMVFWFLSIALAWGAFATLIELRELLLFLAGVSALMAVVFTVKLRRSKSVLRKIHAVAQLREAAPEFFEHYVASLLRQVGLTRVLVRGGGGDRGIDVVGYDKGKKVAVQCKRYAAGRKVTSPEMQKFVGAVQIERATRGLYVTTSTFTAEAKSIAVKQDITLIDEIALVRLIGDNGGGSIRWK